MTISYQLYQGEDCVLFIGVNFLPLQIIGYDNFKNTSYHPSIHHSVRLSIRTEFFHHFRQFNLFQKMISAKMYFPMDTFIY